MALDLVSAYQFGGPTRSPTTNARSPDDFQYAGSTITVTGAPEIRSPTDFQYAANTSSTSGGSSGGSIFGNLFSALTKTATAVTTAATTSPLVRGDQPNQRTPTISTAAVDGQTGFVNSLSDRIRGVLDVMGSVGDGLTQMQTAAANRQASVTPAGYQMGGGPGLNVATIAAVLAVAGVIYVATKD